MGALFAPVTTTPWMENAPTAQATTTVSPLAAQATTTVPPRAEMPQSKTGLHFERCCACHGGQQAQAHTPQPTTEQEVAP
jgi:hypothetical protein